MTWRTHLLSSVGLAILLGAAGCGGPSRVELSPSTIELRVPGQTVKLHARPMAANGAPLPNHDCIWTTSDDKVATVSAVHNQATVSAVGSGHASIRCKAGAVTAEAPVVSLFVAKVTVAPEHLQLRVLDEPTPTKLQVQAFDGQGKPVPGRPAVTSCADENVCRGDSEGSVWPVGAGDSKVTVRVDGASVDLSAHVVDARSAAAKPKRVKGNPMLELERAYQKAERGERRK